VVALLASLGDEPASGLTDRGASLRVATVRLGLAGPRPGAVLHIEVGRVADAADAKGRKEKRLASATILKKPSESQGVWRLADARTQEILSLKLSKREGRKSEQEKE
jgi:hypothetical protein